MNNTTAYKATVPLQYSTSGQFYDTLTAVRYNTE